MATYKKFSLSQMENGDIEVFRKGIEGEYLCYCSSLSSAKKHIDEMEEIQILIKKHKITGLGGSKNSNATTLFEKENGKWYKNHYSNYADTYPASSEFICNGI